MKIGFTGTQQGMTEEQRVHLANNMLIEIVTADENIEFHHGDCIGADAEAHELVRVLFPYATIVIHPPSNPSKRAYCRGDLVLPTKTYLDRNHDIVNSVDYMFATPKEPEEVLRSGTWATIRYARKKNVPIEVITP